MFAASTDLRRSIALGSYRGSWRGSMVTITLLYRVSGGEQEGERTWPGERPCSWLTDRYGLRWQIAPTRLLELVTSDDRETAAAAMRTMFDMKKIVIADLERAVGDLAH